MTEQVVFGAGCFWGVQDILRKIKGVQETEVGYCGGDEATANYNAVKRGTTNHAESVRVVYDSEVISFSKLLDYFFRLHDPTTVNQQGNDRGSQYRSVIFCESDEQKKVATAKIDALNESNYWGAPVVTEIKEQKPFYSAEDYHQDYLEKNPNGYTCHYLRP